MQYQTRDVIPPIEEWTDYGPMLGFAEDGEEPDDWRQYGLKDFGCHAERMGIMDGLGLAAEIDYEMIDGRVVARTPMLELSHEDYQYLGQGGRPYDGLFALGDDGSAYAYDGSLGFFRKLWGGIKKVGKRIAGGAKKLLKRTKVGSYLVKLGEKIYSVASKFVRPLVKFVGKYASKLAPVAALIPGWGPAIAAGLYTAGKVANLMNQYGVKLKGPKGKARGLKFKDKKSAKKFKKALKKAAKKQAKKMKRKGKRGMDGYDGLGFFPGFRKIMKRRRARRKARRVAAPRRVVRRRVGARGAPALRRIGARRPRRSMWAGATRFRR